MEGLFVPALLMDDDGDDDGGGGAGVVDLRANKQQDVPTASLE